MSASSTVASSALTRTRAAVLVVATLAAAYATYHVYSRAAYEGEIAALPGSSLHRRNAVRRRRRRNTTSNTNDDPSSLFIDDEVESDGEGHIIARTLTDGETVVDDAAFQEEFGWANLPQSFQRNGQNIVQLLFRVSEDATRRNAYVHRGCACNSCGVLPIRGVRYRCANCVDYDLCEGCESQGLHIKTHIFYKIKVPAPSFGPRHIQPVWYSGDPDSVMRALPKEITTKLSRETGFERPELDAYWEQWTFMANTDWRDDPDDIGLAMDRKTFERCLVPSGGYRHTAPSLIFDRMFAFYDTNKDDLIGFSEFLHGIAYRKKKDKWNKIFEGYDIDGDGYVDRKDFLRMFRSYYVLFRQMHRDMLEGMEEQQMSSTDAHRLINSRQPLSSAFGQDGRYPPAPDPRTGEGKAPQPNGDLEIVDGKGVMNESSNDTGNREDVFKKDSRMSGSHWLLQDGNRNSAAYWNAMLDPPETVEELPDVLRNLRRIRSQMIALNTRDDSESNAHPVLRAGREEDNEDSSSESNGPSFPGPGTDQGSDQGWPPTFVTVTDEDAEAVDGVGTRVADVRRSRRPAVIEHAVLRERAQRDVYERWQRRHFYTDEEEGATRPADWKEDDDILAHMGIAGESSKGPPRPMHSRSSSKVRFAEDTDDFDTQSNPSTSYPSLSSISVPERWGGIEISDAERDAGKEILYQVTQQAFNELLDPLFKKKEDLAVEAAATKADQERYRSVYTTQEFEAWALEKLAEDEKQAQKPDRSREDAIGDWASFHEAGIEAVREQPLDVLLAATGYEVGSEVPENEVLELDDTHTSRAENNSQSRAAVEEEPGNETTSETYARPDGRPPTSPTEVLSIIAQYDNDHDPTSPQSTPLEAGPAAASEYASPSPSYRDPTFPQFRPDSDVESSLDWERPVEFLPLTREEQEALHQYQQPAGSERPVSPFTDESKPQRGGGDAVVDVILSPRSSPIPVSDAPVSTPTPAGSETRDKASDQPPPPPKDKLYRLWRCDRAAKEAERQGGWGRLSFPEFEALVKKFILEEKGNQMDYLGSWIEYCIPS